MIAIVVVAVLALVLVAALWSRVAASRVERRSVEGYGRALDTLGGVAKRSEAGAPVQAPGADRMAQPHVRPTAGVQPHARMPAEPIAPAPRIRIRPPGPPGRMPVFSDLPTEEGAASQTPAPASGRTSRRSGRKGAGQGAAAPVDEPTIVLPVGLRPVAAPGNGRTAPGAASGGKTGGAGATPLEEEPLTMVADPVPAVEDPRTDDPLTMVLPAVRPDAPPPAAGPAPVYGPPLPGEAMVAPSVPPGEVGTPAEEGAAEHPLFVFDADRGALGSGTEEGDGDDLADGPVEERTLRIRRAATGAAAAVAIGALGAGGWQLAADGSHHHALATTASTGVGRTTTSAHTGSTGTGTGTTHAGTGGSAPGRTGAGAGVGSSPTGGAAPTGTGPSSGRTGSSSGGATGASTGGSSGALKPTASSGSVVDYAAPSGTYTISFVVSGSSPCWLGAQAQPGGPYLWMQTVPAGGTTSYTANGSVVIRLGAPPSVSVEVNGRPVALPSGNVQPYDISFSPQGRAA